MKAKLNALLAGRPAPALDLARVLAMPDVIDDGGGGGGGPGTASSRELSLSGASRRRKASARTGHVDARVAAAMGALEDGGGVDTPARTEPALAPGPADAAEAADARRRRRRRRATCARRRRREQRRRRAQRAG